MSKPWRVVSVILFLCFIFIGIILAIGKARIEKRNRVASEVSQPKVEVVQKTNESNNTTTEVKPEVKPKVEPKTEKVESSSKLEEKVSKQDVHGEPIVEDKTKVVPQEKQEPKGSVLTPSEYPTLKQEGVSKGIISDKNVYKMDNFYLFKFTITLSTKELGTLEVDYFTTISSYNALNIGDLLSVNYSITGDGSIAIAKVDRV